MLLVGQGSVGKTSLVKRLLKDEFDPHGSMCGTLAGRRSCTPPTSSS